MKNTVRKLLGVSLLQSILFAGGSVAPEVMKDAPVVKNTYNGAYIGMGRSKMSLVNCLTDETFSTKGIIFQVGFNYNKYLAIEGRYTHHVGSVHYNHGSKHQTNGGVHMADYPTDFTNIAMYLKPQYSINNISFYALLGYGEVKLTNIPIGDVDRAENGFQWGLGMRHKLTDDLSVFFDYVNMYDAKGFDSRARNADIEADTWTIGLSYKF